MSDCPSCHRVIDADATFCPHCGQSLVGLRRRTRRRSARRRLPYFVGSVVLVLVLSLMVRWMSQRPVSEAGAPPVDLAAVRMAMAEGDWPGAIRRLSPAGEVPASAESRRLLAEALGERCLAEQGRGLERAARVRELSLADDPRSAEGLRARAELESSFGDPRRAASWWDAALGESRRRGVHDTSHEDLLLDAAVARALAGEALRAELLLEELLQRSPEHPRALANRGLLHLAAGRLSLAERDLLSARALEPSLAQARAGLLEVARQLGGGEADPAVQRLGPWSTESVTAQHALALLYEDTGRIETARRHAAAALALAPDEERLQAAVDRLAKRAP